MKLTIQHLAIAFANGQKVRFFDAEREKWHSCRITELRDGEMTIVSEDYEYDVYFSEVLLIVRPLSDLTKEIEHNGERFVPIERLAEIWGNGNYIPNIRQCEWYCKEFYTKDGLTCKFYDHYPFVEISNQYQFTKKLFEWHFDVFGLIEQGLAIDIKNIQQ